MAPRTQDATREAVTTLRPALYEGVIAVLVGLGGLAHVASNLARVSTLWGLALGSLGLLALGSLLVSRKITVGVGAVTFVRLVDKHPDLRIPLNEIRAAGYNEKLRVFEVKTASAAYAARLGRDAAKKLARALKDAGLSVSRPR